MINETETDLQPAPAVLQAMADRVEVELLKSLGRNSQHRRRLSVLAVVGTGVLMFGAGFSIAAVALPRQTDPQFGVRVTLPNGQDVPDSLTIGCFASTSSAQPSEVWAYGGGPGETAARQNPAAKCAPAPTAASVKLAVDAEVATLQAKGALCGSISVNGDPTTAWKLSTRQDGTTATSFTPTAPAGSGCGSLVQLAVSGGAPIPSAACMVAPNSAAVYPLDGSSASAICDSLGEEVWSG